MKQTNNAIKFLMAQYRAIFKNANIAMLAAIAASALAAGQAQAKAVTDWAQLETVVAGDTLTVSGSGSIAPNDKEFSITLDKAGNVIKSSDADKSVTFAAEKGTITVNGNSAALDIGTNNSGATSVTLKGLNVTSGSVTISGKGADTDSSKLTAKLINVGGESTGTPDAATLTVNGHASVNAGTGADEGFIVGKNGKVVIGNDQASQKAQVTGKIQINGGKVSFNGKSKDLAILGSDQSTVVIAGGVVTNETGKGGTIQGSSITLSDSGKIETAHNIDIKAGDSGFNVQGGAINVAGQTTLAITGNTNISAGTVTLSGGAAAANVGTMTVNGDLSLNGEGAKIDLKEGASGGKFTVSGTTTATAGNLSLGSGSVATFNGDASFASGTLTAVDGAKIDMGSVTTANVERTLTVNSKDIKPLLGSAQAIKFAATGAGENMSTLVLKFNDADSEVLDLSSTGLGIIGNDTDGTVTTNIGLTTAKLKVAGNSAKFLGAKFGDGTSYDFKNIEVGSGASASEKAFELAEGANLTVRNSITAEQSGILKTLTVTKGTLTLAGEKGAEGSVEASKVVLNADTSAADVSNLKVTGGQWSVADLTLTKGTAIVEGTKDDGLDVAGTLTLTKDSTLTVNGGYVSTLGNGKVDFKNAAANGVKLTNGTLKFGGDDVLNNNKLSADAIKSGSISGDGASVIVIANASAAITHEQFRQLKKDLGEAFKGTFEMNVTLDPIDGPLNKDNIETALKTEEYNNLTYHAGGTENISATISVGNVKKDSTVNLKLDAGGNLILNNASEDKGAGNFVTINSGSGTTTGGVIFGDENNTLSLGGSGKIASITAETTKHGTVNIGVQGTKYNAGHLTVVKGNSIGSQVQSIKSLSLGDKSSLVVESGDVYTAEFAAKAGTSVDVSGGITAEKFSFNGDSLTATSLTLSGSAKDNTIAGGANVTLDSLTMGDGQALLVGEAGQPAQAGRADETADLGSNAVVYTKSLMMGDTTSSIFVDPNYGTGASLFATDNIGTDDSTVTGKVGIGSNSAFGVGFKSMAAFKDVVGDYLTNNGGFDDAEGKVKNALVLNKSISIAENNGITVDAGLAKNTYEQNVETNKITLGAGAALILTDKAFGANKDQAAIQFKAATGTLAGDATNGSKVILVGDFDASDTNLMLASQNGGSSSAAVTGKLNVEAAGGLLHATIDAGSDSTFALTINEDKKALAYDGVSKPIGDLIIDKVSGKLTKGSTGYGLLSDLIAAGNYKAVDAAAHAATYAGAQQAAVAAVTTMADAMFGRVGAVGVEAASISATGSQANGGVWLTPMYKSVDSDGFNAEGASYGADVDLSGVAFGTDTVNGNMRFGAVFNIGSGDAEGKGNGNGLKDEFDYYGFGIYSAMGFGNFALVGDASMTVISHEVEGLGLRGKADTTAVTMGVTGQYTVATTVVDVTPHLGARFIRLNTDSYDLISANGVEGTTDFDVQNVFSVPLGVTLSKGFTTGGWTLAPSADLTIAFNTGDTEAKSNTFIAGKNIGLNTEVLDEVTYGVTLGLGAQYGAFGTSFGINYTGSENTDSFGVNAQARYMF